MANVNTNVINVKIKNENKSTRGRRPNAPSGTLITCGRCGGSGRDMFTFDGNCPVCKGKGKVRA
jgi:DnaJ-class molecular chaperone